MKQRIMELEMALQVAQGEAAELKHRVRELEQEKLDRDCKEDFERLQREEEGKKFLARAFTWRPA